MTQTMAESFNKWPPAAKRIVANVMGAVPATWAENCYRPWIRFLPQRLRVANFQDKWHKLIKLMDQTQIPELYRMTICLWSKEQVNEIMGRNLPTSRFEEAFQETVQWPLLSRLMRVDQKTYLPDAMLTKVDRASMATGLEVRVPLLDHRVVEFTASLPESFKFRNGTGKYLLKKLLARYVPVSLFERPKMGFGVPIDRWLRFELKDLMTDYLSPSRLNREGLFNAKMIEKVVGEHLSGRLNHQYRLWSLLMWEMWRERWLS
jgi:asparagine synthase (glutamine-hydrolysing)